MGVGAQDLTPVGGSGCRMSPPHPNSLLVGCGLQQSRKSDHSLQGLLLKTNAWAGKRSKKQMVQRWPCEKKSPDEDR